MSLQELSNFSVIKETNDEPETKLEGSEMTQEEKYQPPVDLYSIFEKSSLKN